MANCWQLFLSFNKSEVTYSSTTLLFHINKLQWCRLIMLSLAKTRTKSGWKVMSFWVTRRVCKTFLVLKKEWLLTRCFQVSRLYLIQEKMFWRQCAGKKVSTSEFEFFSRILPSWKNLIPIKFCKYLVSSPYKEYVLNELALVFSFCWNIHANIDQKKLTRSTNEHFSEQLKKRKSVNITWYVSNLFYCEKNNCII